MSDPNFAHWVKERERAQGYPYRQCSCGRQIHVGMVQFCDVCLEKMRFDPMSVKPSDWLEASPTFEDEFRDVPILDLRPKNERAWARFGLALFAFVVTGLVWYAL